MISALLLALSLQILDDRAAAERADAAAHGPSKAIPQTRQDPFLAAAQAARAAAEAQGAATAWMDEEEDTPGQDVEWAAELRFAMRDRDLPMRAGLSGAERDACLQIYDRIGSWRLQRVKLQNIRRDALAQRVSMTSEDEGDWKLASRGMLDLLDAQIVHTITEGDRAAHALMSAKIAFCGPP